jgi:hypothetical protein
MTKKESHFLINFRLTSKSLKFYLFLKILLLTASVKSQESVKSDDLYFQPNRNSNTKNLKLNSNSLNGDIWINHKGSQFGLKQESEFLNIISFFFGQSEDYLITKAIGFFNSENKTIVQIQILNEDFFVPNKIILFKDKSHITLPGKYLSHYENIIYLEFEKQNLDFFIGKEWLLYLEIPKEYSINSIRKENYTLTDFAYFAKNDFFYFVSEVRNFDLITIDNLKEVGLSHFTSPEIDSMLNKYDNLNWLGDIKVNFKGNLYVDFNRKSDIDLNYGLTRNIISSLFKDEEIYELDILNKKLNSIKIIKFNNFNQKGGQIKYSGNGTLYSIFKIYQSKQFLSIKSNSIRFNQLFINNAIIVESKENIKYILQDIYDLELEENHNNPIADIEVSKNNLIPEERPNIQNEIGTGFSKEEENKLKQYEVIENQNKEVFDFDKINGENDSSILAKEINIISTSNISTPNKNLSSDFVFTELDGDFLFINKNKAIGRQSDIQKFDRYSKNESSIEVIGFIRPFGFKEIKNSNVFYFYLPSEIPIEFLKSEIFLNGENFKIEKIINSGKNVYMAYVNKDDSKNLSSAGLIKVYISSQNYDLINIDELNDIIFTQSNSKHYLYYPIYPTIYELYDEKIFSPENYTDKSISYYHFHNLVQKNINDNISLEVFKNWKIRGKFKFSFNLPSAFSYLNLQDFYIAHPEILNSKIVDVSGFGNYIIELELEMFALNVFSFLSGERKFLYLKKNLTQFKDYEFLSTGILTGQPFFSIKKSVEIVNTNIIASSIKNLTDIQFLPKNGLNENKAIDSKVTIDSQFDFTLIKNSIALNNGLNLSNENILKTFNYFNTSNYLLIFKGIRMIPNKQVLFPADIGQKIKDLPRFGFFVYDMDRAYSLFKSEDYFDSTINKVFSKSVVNVSTQYEFSKISNEFYIVLEIDSLSLYSGFLNTQEKNSDEITSSISVSKSDEPKLEIGKVEIIKITEQSNDDSGWKNVSVKSLDDLKNSFDDNGYSISSIKIRSTKQFNNKWAVVISNKNYSQGINPVDYAHNDAMGIINYLTSSLGYLENNIIWVQDATKTKFEELFGNERFSNGLLSNLVSENDEFIIYYSGHGSPGGPEDSEPYLVPVDCSSNFVSISGYPLEVFYKNINSLKAKKKTIILDACFSGKDVIKNVSSVGIKVKSQPIIQDPNTFILTSSRSEEVSNWFNDKKNGLFTYYLLKSINEFSKTDLNNDGILSFKEIYESIMDKSFGLPFAIRRLNQSVQTPQLLTSGDVNTSAF